RARETALAHVVAWGGRAILRAVPLATSLDRKIREELRMDLADVIVHRLLATQCRCPQGRRRRASLLPIPNAGMGVGGCRYGCSGSRASSIAVVAETGTRGWKCSADRRWVNEG